MFYYFKKYLGLTQLAYLKKVHLKETITTITGQGLGGVYFELKDRVIIKGNKSIECVVLIDADGVGDNTYLVPLENYWSESIEEISINKRAKFEFEINP